MAVLMLMLDREVLNTSDIADFVGVGLIRSEHVRTDLHFTDPSRLDETTQYLRQVCTAMCGREVWYRTDDTLSSRANQLRGCEQIIEERNPLIGVRGIRRSLEFQESFKVEVKMIEDVRRDHPALNIILPFVHDARQVSEARALAKDAGYSGEIGMMAEIPAALLCADEFVSAGIRYFVVGLNDLRTLTYGLSRKDKSTERIVVDPGLRAVKMLLANLFTARVLGVRIVLAGDLDDSKLHLLDGFDWNGIAVPWRLVESGKLSIERLRILAEAQR